LKGEHDEQRDRTIGSVLGRGGGPSTAASCSSHAGIGVQDADVENGTIELAFTATDDFTNPTGNVLGAFLAAMLYDTVGPALLATLDPDQFHSTLELNVSFLRPVQPGRIIGRGRVVHRHGDLAFLEPLLTDSNDELIATATATATVIALESARAAA
jgi:uncharacterized protein (TIGR00369 family)